MISWFHKIAVRFMPIDQALSVFGFPAGIRPSPDDLKRRYRELALKYHPDKPQGNTEEMKAINNAYEALQNYGAAPYRPPEQSGYGQHYQPHQPRERNIPEWETDERSSYHEVGQDWRNLNRCKKDIYEHAQQFGDVQPITFWAFDGSFLRGVFTAKANEGSLGFAGEVMEFWNSRGANSYPTIAVLATTGPGSARVVRISGQDVTNENIDLEFGGPNANPGNDRQFIDRLKELVRSRGIDAYG